MTALKKILVASIMSLSAAALVGAQAASFTVTLVPPEHGKLQLEPALPADGKYPAGTVVTVKATGQVLNTPVTPWGPATQ